MDTVKEKREVIAITLTINDDPGGNPSEGRV
jgi:hypothetical protein